MDDVGETDLTVQAFDIQANTMLRQCVQLAPGCLERRSFTQVQTDPSVAEAVLFALFAAPLQHLICVVDQAVCLRNAVTQTFLTRFDFPRLLFTALCPSLFARDYHFEPLSSQTFAPLPVLRARHGVHVHLIRLSI